MRRTVMAGTIFVVLLFMLLMFSPTSTSAVDRGNGDSWSYFVTTSIEVDDIWIDFSGTVEFSQLYSRTITSASRDYDVNVLDVNGLLSGSTSLFGEPIVSANVTIDGFIYEMVAGCGIVKEDVNSLTSLVSGTSGFSTYAIVEKEVVTTYSPPYLSRFSGGSVLGESWTETTLKSSDTTISELGATPSHLHDDLALDCHVAVGSSLESVQTLGGTYDAERITVTDSSGDMRVYWWSGSLDNFVRVSYYHGTSPQPQTTMLFVASERGKSGTSVEILLFGVGVATVVIASIVLAMVISSWGPRSRRPPPDPHSITYVHEVDNSRSLR